MADALRPPVLRWMGTARVFAPGRTLDLGIRTEVEPFRRARSESWLQSEGPGKARTLIVEPDGAFVERGGMRTPLPDQQARHERDQFGIYGYLFQRGPVAWRGPDRLLLSQPGYPLATLHLKAGRPVALDCAVEPPGPGLVIAQHVTFEGNVARQPGQWWPERIAIAQNGKPYFELIIARFHADFA